MKFARFPKGHTIPTRFLYHDKKKALKKNNCQLDYCISLKIGVSPIFEFNDKYITVIVIFHLTLTLK